MALDDKPGKPLMVDRVYLDERAQEVVYRTVKDGKELDDERVFVIRQNPLRMEMYQRHSYDKLRTHWKAPRSVATVIFAEVIELGRLLHNDPRQFDQKFGRQNNDAAYAKQLAPPSAQQQPKTEAVNAGGNLTVERPRSTRSTGSRPRSARSSGRAPGAYRGYAF